MSHSHVHFIYSIALQDKKKMFWEAKPASRQRWNSTPAVNCGVHDCMEMHSRAFVGKLKSDYIYCSLHVRYKKLFTSFTINGCHHWMSRTTDIAYKLSQMLAYDCYHAHISLFLACFPSTTQSTQQIENFHKCSTALSIYIALNAR